MSVDPSHKVTARVLTAILTGVRAQDRTGRDADAGAAFVAEYAPEFAAAAMRGPQAIANCATDRVAETSGALWCVVQLAAQRLEEEPTDLLIDLIRLYRNAARTST